MSAVWIRCRAELRTRWPAALVLALLVGLTGGVVLTAVAGARRTDSAYDRMVEATRAYDVLVNPDLGNESALDPERVARLPMVESFGYMPGIGVGPAEIESLDDIFSLPTAFTGPDGVALFRIGRPNVLEGRMPDPAAPDEVFLDTLAADDVDLEVGDSFPAVVVTFSELAPLLGADLQKAVAVYERGEVGDPVTLTVTGIGATHDGLVVDEGFELPKMIVTPALLEAHPDSLIGFWAGMTRLERGAADEPAFRKAVEAMVPGETIEFQSSARIEETVDRAVRPYVVALTLFAVVIAATSLLVIGQALARQRFLDAADDTTLRMLGFTHGQTLAVAALRSGLVAVTGVVVAAAIAVSASPLMPIGPVRQAEPDGGLAVDGLVFGAGALALVAIVGVLGVAPAWRLVRTRITAGGPELRGTGRPSAVSGALARHGAPPATVTGVRFALESGRGRAAVPARTTIVGAIGAVVTVAAALTFAASLEHLIGTPRLYGINYDARLNVAPEPSAGLDDAGADVAAVLGERDDIDAWSRADLSRIELDGHAVPAIGVEMMEGEVAPTVVDGRLPADDDDIALGSRTLEDLGVEVGETVTATFDGTTRELEIVGRVVLPGVGNYPGGDKTSIGDGALVTREVLQALAPGFEGTNFLLRFHDGVDHDAAREALVREFAAGGVVEVQGVEQPADVVDYERVRATPLVLAAILAVLGVATVTHALVTTVRRRRRDLAVLRTLGFTRPQVSGTVAWQATTVAVVALVAGLPIGIAAGRLAWTLLAEDVGTVAEPVTPLVAVLLSIPAAVLVANLVAAVPGWFAGRTPPGSALRSE